MVITSRLVLIMAVDISQTASAGYAGIHLFESGGSGVALNPLGQVYHDYATGQR